MFYKDGHLLYSGGIADQPLEYLQAMAAIGSAVNRLKYSDEQEECPDIVRSNCAMKDSEMCQECLSKNGGIEEL